MTSFRLKSACVLAGTLAFSVSTAFAGDPVAVTTCGQVIEGDGYLTGDLDCSSQDIDEPTVTLKKRGTLDLAGYTITGRVSDAAWPEDDIETITCNKSCTIKGPGTIVGSPVGPGAVVGFSTWDDGREIDVIDATITGGMIGVSAIRTKITNAAITNNRAVGVWTFFTRVENSTITGNGLGTDGFERTGVFGQVKSLIRNSTVTGNGMAGVSGRKLRIEGSNVTGNDAFADCATRVCADLAARTSIRVDGATSCDTSLHLDGPPASINQPIPSYDLPNWGVCTLD